MPSSLGLSERISSSWVFAMPNFFCRVLCSERGSLESSLTLPQLRERIQEITLEVRRRTESQTVCTR